MPLISKDFIQDINDTRLDDIARKMGLKLKKLKGDEFIIPCVSYDHDDKNPSMSINTTKQEFFCHSCGCSGGGAINFLSAFSGINPNNDFVAAVESASSFLGRDITYEPENEGVVSQRDAINHVHDSLHRQDRPTEPLLAEFISSRGITRNDIAEWGLQYAQKGFGLKFQKNLVPTLNEMGLAIVKESAKTGGSYQFFSLNERLIFPINNERGQLVAFAGRKLSDDAFGPKYKNTDNTTLFTKMNVLYGLDKVVANHKQSGKEGKVNDIQVLEGYMDVIATHRVGLKTSVASMGTSFPVSQLELLSKHAHGATFMFDNDAAGIKASQSAMLKACALSDKMRFRFAISPNHEGEKTDPDFLIKNGLIDEYVNSMNNAAPLSAVAAQYVMGTEDVSSPEDLIGPISDRAKEIYLAMPAGIVREAFSQEIAKLISNKIGFTIDPSIMGMRLDSEGAVINQEESQKQSIKTKAKDRSDPKPNTDIKKPIRNTTPTPNPTDYFSPEQPDLDDWVAIPDGESELVDIGKILSIDRGMLLLATPNMPEKRLEIPANQVVKIKTSKSILSKFSNQDTGVKQGDTVLLVGEKWHHRVPNPINYQLEKTNKSNPINGAQQLEDRPGKDVNRYTKACPNGGVLEKKDKTLEQLKIEGQSAKSPDFF